MIPNRGADRGRGQHRAGARLTVVAATARGRRFALAAALWGTVALALASVAVAVAIPDIRLELGASPSGAQWAQNVFVLVMALLVLPLGWLGDRIGPKGLVVAGMLVFGAGSAVCALAGSTVALIAGRAVQGVGAAALPAHWAWSRRGDPAAYGRTLAGAGLLVALAVLAAGAVVELTGWRWVFWLTLAATALTGATALAAPDAGGRETGAPEGGGRSGTGPAALAATLVGCCYAITYLVPQYYEFVLDGSPLRSGLMLLLVITPAAGLWLLSPALVGRVGTRRLVAAGVACAAAGMFAITLVDADTGPRALLPGLLLLGVGLGLACPVLFGAGAMPARAWATLHLAAAAVLLAASATLAQGVESERRAARASFDSAFSDSLAAAAWLLLGAMLVVAAVAALIRRSTPRA
jgi:MFS family permease